MIKTRVVKVDSITEYLVYYTPNYLKPKIKKAWSRNKPDEKTRYSSEKKHDLA